MLIVRELNVSYGRTAALRGVSLEVGEGEIVCIVGPNGAGKSTLLSTASGIRKPDAGTILFDGAPITGWRPEDIARRGLAMVPEGRRIFQTLTVRENLLVPARGSRTEQAHMLNEVVHLFPVLAGRLDMRAGNLSGGEQQQLAIGRALVMKPRLMMLDEPSLGLAPLVIETVYGCIRRLRDDGVTLLIVEQSTARITGTADRFYVLNNGAVALSGRTEEIRGDLALDDAYFGVAPSAPAAALAG